MGWQSRNLSVGWRVEGGGHYVRILYVGWSCMDSLCVVMRGGHQVFHFILFLYVDWPLLKDSLCGVAIMYFILFCFSMWTGHYIRILYVGWPSCICSYFVYLCGVAITEGFSMWGGHHVRKD